MIISALVGAALGGALGWTVRSSKDGTRTRVLEELYSRKLRLAEQLRDESIKTLNANRIEMAGFGERFAALDGRIEGLRESLAVEKAARATAEGSLARVEGEIGAWKETAEQAVRASEEFQRLTQEAELRSASAANAMDQAYGEVMDLANNLTRAEQLSSASNAQAAELEVQLMQRDLALDDLRSALTRVNQDLDSTRAVLFSRDGEVARLEGLAAELEPLRNAIVERDAELARIFEEAARQASLIGELSPLAAAFPETLAEREALALRQGELESQLSLATARAAELPALQRAHGQLEERAHRVAQELERERNKFEKLQATSQTREEELRNAKRECTRLEKEFATTQEHAQSSVQELERERHRFEKLQATAQTREEELRNAKRECTRLEKEFATTQEHAHSTAQELERERHRFEKLQATAQTREEDLRSAKRECARLEKEFAATAASVDTKQRELERRDAKISSLEASLAERNNRIRVLTPVSRSNAARGTLRPQAAKRPVPTPVRDDLKRIAGIGPVLAKKLRRFGVASFDQLAELTRSDLEVLAEKLGIAAERIRREGWVTSARVEARVRNRN